MAGSRACSVLVTRQWHPHRLQRLHRQRPLKRPAEVNPAAMAATAKAVVAVVAAMETARDSRAMEPRGTDIEKVAMRAVAAAVNARPRAVHHAMRKPAHPATRTALRAKRENRVNHVRAATAAKVEKARREKDATVVMATAIAVMPSRAARLLAFTVKPTLHRYR